jgi:ubiquitin-protein ligase
MRPRMRRLTADFAKVESIFTSHPYVQLVSYEGDPAESYIFDIFVPSLVPSDGGGDPYIVESHRMEVILPLDYPRRPPFCRMLSAVYHPNIDPTKICIGDHWSAGQSLAHLVVRVGEMLAYQSFNVKSPLNAEAAAWADQNRDQFPLLAADLAVGL